MILAVPSQTIRANARSVAGVVPRAAIVVSAAKGLELSTGQRMTEVLAEELAPSADDRVCALSGPNLASEVVRGLPASTVIASRSVEVAVEAQRIVNSPVFRVYTNEDVVGVELSGALKNVIALGAGICDGLRLGDNAKSSFITRGLVEITRLGVAAGAVPSTFAGLAGMGDLIATCSSTLSRNHHVGPNWPPESPCGRSVARWRTWPRESIQPARRWTSPAVWTWRCPLRRRSTT